MLRHSLLLYHQIEYSHHPRCNITFLFVHLEILNCLFPSIQNLMIENEEQNDRIENLLTNSTFRNPSDSIPHRRVIQQGFAILNTQGYEEAPSSTKLECSRHMKTFRFPSHSESINIQTINANPFERCFNGDNGVSGLY